MLLLTLLACDVGPITPEVESSLYEDWVPVSSPDPSLKCWIWTGAGPYSGTGRYGDPICVEVNDER